MDSAEDLRRRIRGTTELGSVVRTMKALSAANARQSEQAVLSLVDYAATIELAMQAVSLYLPDDLQATALTSADERDGMALGAIVFGTDQGMCGPFNDQIASFAAEDVTAGGGSERAARVWAIGERLLPGLREAGLSIDRLFSVPSSIEGLSVKVSELLVDLENWRTGHGLDQIRLYYNRGTGPGAHRPNVVRFWPVDLSWLTGLRSRRWESNTLPLVRVPWQEMLRRIAQQYLYIGLYRGLAESLASENSSRLLTMERAEKNIDERLEELTAEYNYVRQQAITVELLDIVSGFEALADEQKALI